jgi:hydrogenase assembly chaperone HypC/HupF
MCLSRPARLVEVDDDQMAGVVDQDGREHPVSLAVLTAGGVQPGPGDWVLMNSGIPIEVIDQAEANELMTMLEEAENL